MEFGIEGCGGVGRGLEGVDGEGPEGAATARISKFVVLKRGRTGPLDMNATTPTAVAAPKKHKSSTPGPGSFRVLEILGRLGIAGVEPLAAIGGLSLGTTYDHIRRLETAGLAFRLPYRDGSGGSVGITRRGAHLVRDDGIPAVFPNSQLPVTGVHSRAVSWVAALLEVRGRNWLGPADLHQDRAWRLTRDDDAGYYPDLGYVDDNGGRHAIEVELHSKSNHRLRAILRAYGMAHSLGAIENVTYLWTRLPVIRAVDRNAKGVALTCIKYGSVDQAIGTVRELHSRRPSTEADR